LIVFNHGWGVTNPRVYGAWIEHLVRRGNIVVYPSYQEQWRNPPTGIAGNAIRALKAAVQRLADGTQVKPDLDKVAFVGHSAGGQTTANMAALARSSGIPEPKAIMFPLANKNYITLVSDDHGKPELVANHFATCAIDRNYDSGEKGETKGKSGSLLSRLREKFSLRAIEQTAEDYVTNPHGQSHPADALDYYGLWKLFDELSDAAFYGRNRAYALGNTAQQRYMGKWSDGVMVKELVMTDKP
jgi:pimeloyl-ACP methyl ester carboxylesterase